MRRPICTFVVYIWQKTRFRMTWPKLWQINTIKNWKSSLAQTGHGDLSWNPKFWLLISAAILGTTFSWPTCSWAWCTTSSGVISSFEFCKLEDRGGEWEWYKFPCDDMTDAFCELSIVVDDKYGFSDVDVFGVFPTVGVDERLDRLKSTESGSILSVSLANSSWT